LNREERKILDRMFQPRGVAVIGAVHEPGKFGHMVIQSHLKYGYPGQIYPIHPKGGETLGLKVFGSLDEIHDPVDLAMICVTAENVPQVLRDCLRKGIVGAEILASGFAETGQSEGIGLQDDVRRISKEGIRVLGPNCFGACCPKGGITFLPGFGISTKPGSVALISQSGGVALDFGHEARMSGFDLSKAISYGNGCDLDAVGLMEYLEKDEETRYVGAYIEGVDDGRRFTEVLKAVTPHKPVVIWKGGLTPLGKRSVRSHTASLSGEAHLWKGLLAQTGAVPVEGLDELVDTLAALVYLRRRGRRIALIGGGGAIGVFTSDLAYRWGMDLPPFGKETQARLRRWFPTPGNSMLNPLDTGSPALPQELISGLMEEILLREPVDVLILMVLVHSLGVVRPTFMKIDGLPWPELEDYTSPLLQRIVQIRERTGKDVVVVMENRANLVEDAGLEGQSRAVRTQFHQEGVVTYPNVERALRAIRNASLAEGRKEDPDRFEGSAAKGDA
jgi:acyl-CoA synthetase (NDP forming)